MIARSFEIKICLLGNVSAGKTTVLNALFCDKFSEVSMKRTTAGINFFRVHTTANTASKDSSSSVDSLGSASKDSSSSVDSSGSSVASVPTRSAKSILTEISADNVKLRKGDEIQEKTFDIQLKKDLVPMRKDTKLVFCDIPGINEANVVNKYKDYVSEKWESFDMVIVVMDARMGVNTEDQVFLLNFVKEQLKKKDIPVIVLCNKVDDPEDEEQAELVKEARKEVEKIFSADCRDKALEQVMKQWKGRTTKKKLNHWCLSPAFIPVSAIHAFIHQSASLMSRKSFDRFDKDLLEKLGREQIGRRRWNRLSKKEKHDEAFKVIKDGYEDGLKDSNFDKLLTALNQFLGGEEMQQKMIELQIWTAVRSLSKRPFPPGGLSSLVQGIYEKRKLLEASGKTRLQVIASLDLVDSFWTTFESLEAETFKNFEANFPEGFNLLSDLMSDLVQYHQLASLPDWKDTSERVVAEMDELVQRYFTMLIDLQKKDRDTSKWGCFGSASLPVPSSPETSMTPHDWAGVWGSLLLISYSKTFNERFGQEKIVFERLAQQAHRWCEDHSGPTECRSCKGKLSTACGTPQNRCCHTCKLVFAAFSPGIELCPSCGYMIENGVSCPQGNCRRKYKYLQQTARLDPWYDEKGRLLPYKPNGSVSKPALRVVAPKSCSDPSHVAHIVWKFCDFLESLETKKQTQKQAATIDVATEDDESWEMK